MTEPWQPISDEELERQRVSLQTIADSGYAESGGGIAGVLSLIARIDLERNRADRLQADLAKKGYLVEKLLATKNELNHAVSAAEAEVVRLIEVANQLTGERNEARDEVARLWDQLATIVDLADDLVEARYLGARERLQRALAALAAPPDQPTGDEFLTCPDCGWATDEGADMARHECGPNA